MNRSNGGGRGPCRIVVRHDRLALSRSAAEELPEYIDLYENGNILALKGNLEGQIRLSIGSHKYRQNIRVKQVMDYVREKYECEVGDVLSAWYRDGALMFCRLATKEDVQAVFDERFQKIEVDVKVPEKYSLRVRGKMVTLSGAAGALFNERLTVYEGGDILAFVPDEEGALWISEYSGNGNKAIYSSELADHIKKKHGSEEVMLYGWEHDGTVFFSSRRTTPRKSLDSGDYIKKSFEMRQETVTVNILQNSRLLISELGAALLGEHITLHESGKVFALCSDAEGEFRTTRSSDHSGCDITGRDLVRYIKERLDMDTGPNCRLQARVRGSVVYFSNDEISYLPPFRRFKAVEFGRVCEMRVISMIADKNGRVKLYISRSSRGHLKGQLSLYRCGDVWAIKPSPEGSLRLNASGYVSCKGLSKQFRSIVKPGERVRFYVLEYEGSVFFSRKRLRESNELSLNRFEELTESGAEAVVSLPGVFRSPGNLSATNGAPLD